MTNIIEITDIGDPALDVYARLTDSQLRAAYEAEHGILIAESPKVIACALDAGLRPLSLLSEARHLRGSAREILERCGDIPVYTGPREVLSSLTGYAPVDKQIVIPYNIP